MELAVQSRSFPPLDLRFSRLLPELRLVSGLQCSFPFSPGLPRATGVGPAGAGSQGSWGRRRHPRPAGARSRERGRAAFPSSPHGEIMGGPGRMAGGTPLPWERGRGRHRTLLWPKFLGNGSTEAPKEGRKYLQCSQLLMLGSLPGYLGSGGQQTCPGCRRRGSVPGWGVQWPQSLQDLLPWRLCPWKGELSNLRSNISDCCKDIRPEQWVEIKIKKRMLHLRAICYQADVSHVSPGWRG